ncbi:MAG: hypothetical protein IJC41_03880 [Firmicutes bacterium]|nr:hypothetical protein [Bacillota bacterium]
MSRETLKAYCSEEERQIIESHAARYGKTVSGYMREVALYGRAFNINYDAIMEHTKIINNLKEEMHLIIKMLVQTKQAYPADVQRMVSLLEEITENQRTMLQRTLKEHEKLHKLAKSVPKCP